MPGAPTHAGVSGDGWPDPRARAALRRILPADEHPSVVDDECLPALRDRALSSHRMLWKLIEAGLDMLDAESRARDGEVFVRLTTEQQDALLGGLERGATLADWKGIDPVELMEALVAVANETYDATRDGPGWAMVRYDAAAVREPQATIEHTMLESARIGDARTRYDVVVLGAGAGGGTAAAVLAEAGASVLVVEHGEFLPYGVVGRDHLANHRLALRGHNTGPDAGGSPRVHVDLLGEERLVEQPWDARWSNNAMTVGGGTRVYLGMAWRFLPEDFRMASLYGVPAGSSLADWPLDYEELEPYYSEAEWELGVCGDASGHRVGGARSRDYPMRPLPENREAGLLRAGATRLGIATGPVPLLINSEPRAGRPRCVGCGECVGFACPSDAKNGSWNAMMPRALATGRCSLVTGAHATAVTVGPTGHVQGVDIVDWATGSRHSVAAGHVVVACGAIESARLLLASRSPAHPRGLGNHSDQLGRHLQGHLYVSAFGIFDDEVIEMGGPGVTIGTCEWNHSPSEGLVGGGCLHNEAIKLPAVHRRWALPPGTPRWGLGAKHAMADLYRRTSHVHGPVQEIPTGACRVTLAEGVADRHGSPVARWASEHHPETLRVARRQRQRGGEWLLASGARHVWTSPVPSASFPGQHQAGTCRMGDDPATSVTDRWGRVHGHPNLWVMDGSVHVTNGGFNPVLTIYALALRSAAHLARGDVG